MRILLVSPTLPFSSNLGASLRVRSLITALEQLGKVDCVFFTDKEKRYNTDEASCYRVVARFSRPAPGNATLLSLLLRRLPPNERDWLLSFIPSAHRLTVAENSTRERFYALKPDQYDLVFFVRITTLSWLRWRGSSRTVIDIDDVEFLSAKQSAEVEVRIVPKLIKLLRYHNIRRTTLMYLKTAAAAFVCSAEDKKRITNTNIHVLPNVFPDRGQMSRPIRDSDSQHILFVGALVYKPNREAVEYFVAKVLPIIRNKAPDVIFQVIGRSESSQHFSWANAPGVCFLGNVSDIDTHIEHAALEVVPILNGMGTRIKILEAMSFGKPVVSTSKGAYGLPFGLSKGLIRTDNPEDMAAACLALLSDRDKRLALGVKAKEAVATTFSQVHINTTLNAIVQGLKHDHHNNTGAL